MTKMFRVIRQVMLIRASVPAMHVIEIIEMPCLREPIPRYSMNKELKCSRCERTGHLPAFCIAKYDIGGHEIEDYEGVGTGTHA